MSQRELLGVLGLVAVGALAGPVVHVLFLVAPLCGLGLLRQALEDPSVRLFLALAVAFSLADLPTLFHEQTLPLRSSCPTDRSARRWGWVTGLLLLASFWIALVDHALAGPREPGRLQAWGVLLMSTGIALRAAAVLSLGRGFVTEWRIAADQPLVDRHIYAWVRHPSEAGNLSVFLGACLLLESRLALALLVILGPSTLHRIRREDRHLAEVYGQRFVRYARRVKRLVPGIY